MTLRLGALVWVFCLCFSSYSLAYDQQYKVGSTGPNGGVVTDVTVTSTLLDTTSKQVGDNLETTNTYKWTEIVKEDVTTTQQITTTTYETVEKTTGDIINNTTLSNGTVTCTSSGTGIYLDNCADHTRYYDDMHGKDGTGQYQFQTNLNNWMTQQEIQNGFSVTGSAQGYSSTNTAYLTITLKVLDPTSGADQYSSRQWLVSQNTWTTFSHKLDVTSNSFSDQSILLSTFSHSDAYGYMWSGDYQNFQTSITYNELTAVLNTIEQTIVSSIQSSLESIESSLITKYNPVTQTTELVTTPTTIEEPKSIEIKMESSAGDIIKFDVKVETTAEGSVSVSMTDIKSGETQIAEIKPIETMASNDAKVEIKVASTDSKTEGSSSSQSKSEDSKKGDDKKSDDKKENDSKSETKVTVAEAKQKVADRILQQVLAQTDAILINDTKLGLMIALSDTENFAKYQAKRNEDLLQWYKDDGIYLNQKQMPDPYSVIFNLAQDKLMEKMENEQYKADFGK